MRIFKVRNSGQADATAALQARQRENPLTDTVDPHRGAKMRAGWNHLRDDISHQYIH